jgi:deoxyribonuclease IV
MFGSHLSIAGGMHNALMSAERLGMQTVQVFTKNQQQWNAPPLSPDVIVRWKAERDRLGFKATVSHDSYLINLASPDETTWYKSIEAFADEYARTVSLGIPYLVTHPGAHLGCGETAGLLRVAKGLDAVFSRFVAGRTIVCLEATAGQGTSLGYRLEHLAEIHSHSAWPDRLGVCLDTAHLFAAGYDFRGRGYDRFRRELSRTIGLRRVKVLHLNDSKKALGSRVDRHEHIGKGTIGLEGFGPFVRDDAFARVPKILETPKDGTGPDGRAWDAINLDALRSLMVASRRKPAPRKAVQSR